jgi:hypothetical protein
MMWLNSDDKLLPGSLHTIGELYSRFPEIHWLTSSLPVIWNVRGQVTDCTKRPGFNRELFCRGGNLPGESWYARSWIQQESTSWRRSLWDSAGGKIDDTLKFAGDFELWLRFFHHSDLFSVQTLIGGFRIHGNQKTGTEMTSYQEEAMTCLRAGGNYPFGRVQSGLRRLLTYTLCNNPHSIDQMPPWIVGLLRESHLIYPTKTVRWTGKKWQIQEAYTF